MLITVLASTHSLLEKYIFVLKLCRKGTNFFYILIVASNFWGFSEFSARTRSTLYMLLPSNHWSYLKLFETTDHIWSCLKPLIIFEIVWSHWSYLKLFEIIFEMVWNHWSYLKLFETTDNIWNGLKPLIIFEVVWNHWSYLKLFETTDHIWSCLKPLRAFPGKNTW
jgi:hypothetical protein